jgi:two-component system, OmpR family, phosphate regulon sensor histidine kinase PhoR
MKRFSISVCIAICVFVLMIVLSVWGKSLYLDGMQHQASHLMQFMNEYVIQSKRDKSYTALDETAKKLSSMSGYRICIFSADGDVLADSDTTGKKAPELFFPITSIKVKDKIVSSSIFYQDNQYVINEFYPVQLDETEYIILCATFPLDGYSRFILIQKILVVAGLVVLVTSVVVYIVRKTSIQEKEITEPQMDSNLKNQIDQIKLYSNERISLLSTVLTNIESGIILFSPDCSILLMNPMAQQLTGAKSSLFFPDRNLPEIALPQVLLEIRTMVQESMAAKKPIKKDLQTEDGKILSIRTTVVYSKYIPFTFYGIQAFISDVTEKRRMERIRDEFVSNVSHELRTPLTLICGFTETLQNWNDLEEEDRRHALEIIEIESNRLKHMISQLLDLSHIESRIDAGRLIPINPIESIQSIGSSLEALAENHNITFRMDLTDKKIRIMGDKNSIIQIVTNLSENAIKYTPAGGMVQLVAKADENNLVIQVQDNGIGIAESEIPHIFERFYRVEKSRNKKSGGSGLGLAITKGLVEELGGSITVKSQLHIGSTFTVKFPLLQQTALPHNESVAAKH